MIGKIGNVSIFVDNQDKAIDFWVNKVNFELRGDAVMGPNMRWVEVAPKGAQTVLVLYPKNGMPDYANRNAAIVFECDDMEDTYKFMKENGVEFKGEPAKLPFGQFVSFNDESGNTFGLRSAK